MERTDTYAQTLAREALRLYDGGLSPMPIKGDGSKSPDLPEWGTRQTKRPPREQILKDWETAHAGLGVVCGLGSADEHGNPLEYFDCDDPTLLPDFAAMVDRLAPGLIDKLPKVFTPKGVAFWYRYEWQPSAEQPEPEGNQKLAFGMRPDRYGRREGLAETALWETRAHGGQALAPPSAGAVNIAGGGYRYADSERTLTEVPLLSGTERDILLSCARAQNEITKPERTHRVPPVREVRLLSDPKYPQPGEDYNAKMRWEDVLRGTGAEYLFNRGETEYWRRPGKSKGGHSATINYQGSDLLYVFSSNWAPFEPEHAYDKFSAYTLLQHGGDYKEASRALLAQGFGVAYKDRPDAKKAQEDWARVYHTRAQQQPEQPQEAGAAKGDGRLILPVVTYEELAAREHKPKEMLIAAVQPAGESTLASGRERSL